MRRCISAGTILPGPANDAFEERFGVELLHGYGITEWSTMMADAAGVAMPHDDLGEVPVVFVVPTKGHSVDPAVIKQAVRERLASFKVPAHLFTADVIPRTGSGRTKRFQLQQDIPEQL